MRVTDGRCQHGLHRFGENVDQGQWAMNEASVLSAVLRTDFASFVWKCFNTIAAGTEFRPNWHIGAIAYQLTRVQNGEVKRLLINQPPRSLKSISVSVAYVAWLLGHDSRETY